MAKQTSNPVSSLRPPPHSPGVASWLNISSFLHHPPSTTWTQPSHGWLDTSVQIGTGAAKNPNETDQRKMSTESTGLEERLKSVLVQLKTEAGILDRIVYKGKNQHRHCLYFQYLLKVRRDLKLLLSAGLQEILVLHFQVINGKNAKQKLYVLNRLKEKMHYSMGYNFQQRLLGVARLLSQMVEPILKAAVQISTLLARTFFMGFSLTVLSLLARLRVLIQQVLLDVVSVFNTVASISQKEQSVKLRQHAIEVYQEYYPPSREIATLECVWEGDKFRLLENKGKTETKIQGKDLQHEQGISLEMSSIQYHRTKVSNEAPCVNDDGCEMVLANINGGKEPVRSHVETKRFAKSGSSDGSFENIGVLKIEDFAARNDVNDERFINKNLLKEASNIASTNSSSLQKRPNNAAFVPVRRPPPSERNETGPLQEIEGGLFLQ